MSGSIRHRSETDIRLRELEKEAAKNSSPCSRPPATPTTVPTLYWGAVEIGHHLGYRVRVGVSPVTEDIHGFPDDSIQSYEIQAVAQKANGTAAENANGKPISRFVTVSASDKISNAASVPSGGDSSLWLHADLGKAVKPKWLYWKARYRAQNGAGCWSDWSDWCTPEKPNAADTTNLPPAPTYKSMNFDVVKGGRGNKHRLIVTFAPVQEWDLEGGDTEDDVARYVVQLWLKEPTGSWTRHSSRTVEDKDGDNAGDDISVVFHNIQRGNKYRVRLRSVDRWNRRGAWSGWKPDTNGTSKDDTDKPSGVGTVNAVSAGPRRVEFDWEDSSDPEVARYVIVLQSAATQNATSWTTVKTVKHKQSRYRYVVPKADIALWFRASVVAQTDADAAGNRLDSATSTSDAVQCGADDAADPGTPGGEVPRLQLPQNASSAFNISTKVQSASWTTPDSLTGYSKTRLIGYGSNDPLNDVWVQLWTANSVATQANASATYTKDWTAAGWTTTYAWARVTIQHIADTSGAKQDGPVWTGDKKATRSDSGTAPPPANPGELPTVTIPSRTASPFTGGIRFRIRLTGVSGAPNGTANQIAWVLRRSANASAAWTDQPFAAGAPGDVHAQGVIPTVARTTGTTVDYSGTADYFAGQNSSQQMYFQLYAKAQDTTQNAGTDWVKSGEFTLGAPAAPGAIDTTQSAVYVGANGYPYFNLYFTPSADDIGTPGSGSMGENDVAYWLNWQISTATSAPSSGWNEIFKRTSSSLGDGVTWTGSQYLMRIPATGRLDQVIPGTNYFMWVKVRCQRIGDGGDDLAGGANLRGATSTFNTAVKLPRGN